MEIVTAWAQRHVGPGWSNTLVWYIWRDDNNRLHEDCFQPDKQTAVMLALFNASAAIQSDLTHEVRTALAAAQEGE